MSIAAAKRIPGYRIEAVQGDGAMATVYRAVHKGLEKPVALKVLHEAVAADEEYRARFLREGRAAARINHPNVVRAYEAGEHEGLYYLAMELVEGRDLADRLGEEGRLPEDEALRIAAEVAKGLSAAEAHGMVHRDVKPENVLLGNDGQVKLADLGLAKLHGDGFLTREGFTLGTVAFFSPEQCRGSKTLDIRSDLYSLGVVLYDALTGALPFGRGENPVLTMERILNEPPPDVAEAAPVSERTAQAVRTLMARDPRRRPASAEAAARLLEETRARREEPLPAPPRKKKKGRPRRKLRRAARAGGRRRLALALGLLALALGLGAGLLWLQGGSGASAPQAEEGR